MRSRYTTGISTHYLTQRQTTAKRLSRRVNNISTHYLTQRQTLSALLHGRTKIFQLTTSRRGRRFDSSKILTSIIISTHYLTQRQTVDVLASYKDIIISTHYLTQRQTVDGKVQAEALKNFNSLPHAEVDMVVTKTGMTGIFQLTTSRRGRLPPFGCLTVDSGISTHYLTQRQTARLSLILLVEKLFQLTTSRRGRLMTLEFLTYGQTFQLTTSRRGRRQLRLTLFTSKLFQLTTSRRGRRILSGDSNISYDISTHYLTQRQTARQSLKQFPL